MNGKVNNVDFNKLIGKDFSGCISVKKKGIAIFEQAYGYGDMVNERKNNIDTKFATASAGKVFVAVGILQLIEKGKLNFNTTIGEILDIDFTTIDKEITIEQLLTHKSGIPDYFDESVMEEYDELWINFPNYKIRSSSDLLPLFIDKPMIYPRGERFEYNNTGFVVLGLVIEVIEKMPFDKYLKENIFDICNMNSTGYYELDRLPANCANNYIYDEKKQEYYTNIYSVDVKGTGAGGAFTTIADVERFWTGLLNNKLISNELKKNMLTVHSSSDYNDSYGYGIWINNDFSDGTLPYFTGSDPGVSFVSFYKLDEDVLVTIVSNFGDNVWRIMRELKIVMF